MVVLIVLMIHISTGNAPHFQVLYNIGNTICTNGNANGTIGSPNGTIGTIGKPMVPLVSQRYHWLPMIQLVKFTNGTIGRTPNRAIISTLDPFGAG